MTDPWEILMRAGLPDGAIRPPPVPPLDENEVRGALHAIVVHLDALDPARREPLLAWLSAWRHHFAADFAHMFGAEGHGAIASLDALSFDANRYLKLRRIAISNLAAIR